MNKALVIVVLALASLASFDANARDLPDLSVDLHAHLFMKPGLGWFFSGSFDEPLKANSWDDRLSSKANEPSVMDSGIGILVVALFAHPLYRGDVRDAIREQIAEAEAFVARNPSWRIARSPEDAERWLLAGKRVLVLSLEGAGGVLESEADLAEFIDQKGIRIVTPLHLVDDRYGGVATMNGFQYVANPMSVVDQLLDAHCDNGIETNRQGLSPLGERLAYELVRRGVWLDLTHSSDEALQKLVPIAESAKQPLLLTHTSLRHHRHAERSLSNALIARVAKSRGILGILPSDDAFEQMSPAPGLCPAGCSLEACTRGIPALATMYREMAEVVGYDHVMLGSDMNGGMRHLSASCGVAGELGEEAGFFHIGQTGLVWKALAGVGANVPPMRMTARAFLDAWQRVQPSEPRRPLDLPELPSRDQTDGPGWRLELGAGLSSTPGGDAPGVVLMLDSLVQKDTGFVSALEPAIYFAHVNGDVVASFTSPTVPYLNVGLSALGVKAAWLDNQAEAEALHARVRRNLALDQALSVNVQALRGRVRTMPGILKEPEHYNLFIDFDVGLLGFKQLSHHADGAVSRGVYLAGGRLGLGASAYPGPGLMLSLMGSFGADVTAITSLALDGFFYQSDMAGGGVLVLRTVDGVFRQELSLMRYFNVESQRDTTLDDTQLRGTMTLAF